MINPLRWLRPVFLLGLAALGARLVAAETPQPWDTFSDTWAATDALSRSLPGSEACGAPRSGKTVGIFYFLWLTGQGEGPLDITQLVAANPQQPQYGSPGAFHWWGQPLFGYYRSDDEFVIRKHAQMLSDAGVDVVFFDVTNGLTYDATYLTLCRVFTELRSLGQKTPQIAFLANSHSAQVVQRLYDQFYAKNLYSELWFHWQGRPLILTPPDGLQPQVQEFFTLRHSWAWTDPKSWFGNGRDKWPWVDHYPQRPGWHASPEQPEQISVCVAQHPVSNIGRSFRDGRQPAPGQTATEQGLCFAEQCRRALRVDPEFVFVTGWNEWIAQRFVAHQRQRFLDRIVEPGETYFVDQYNQEFSRDIEPMQGGHGDNYYYQLVSFVRQYKGVRPVPPVTARPIAIDGRFEDWAAVLPEYRDTIGDPVRREHPGWGRAGPYVNRTGRNDLMRAKVSYDTTHVYFYVQTRQPLTAPADPNWMLLYIDADQNPATGWLGYDYVLNHVPAKPQLATLARHQGQGYQWVAAAEVPYRTAGNELEVAIPRAVLGLNRLPAKLAFKWADNIQQTGEASDFSLNGDVAPNDRFNYQVDLQ